MFTVLVANILLLFYKWYNHKKTCQKKHVSHTIMLIKYFFRTTKTSYPKAHYLLAEVVYFYIALIFYQYRYITALF